MCVLQVLGVALGVTAVTTVLSPSSALRANYTSPAWIYLISRTLIDSVASWDGDSTVIANMLERLLGQPTLDFSEVCLQYF